MSDSAITLELPRFFVTTTTVEPAPLPPRLARIVERNRDHGLTAALFAIATVAAAALTALGIAGLA